MIVTNGTFDQNTASGDGGGIYSSITTLRLTNSTFSGNDAGRWGGAHQHRPRECRHHQRHLRPHSAAADGGGGINNVSGTLTPTNTVIADNTAGGDCVDDGTLVDGGHNLIEDTGAGACGLTDDTNGNIIGQDPNLDPGGLQDNGGPTQTVAVRTGSPAINAGDQSICANTSGTAPVNGLDQRGVARPGAGLPNCTIGAYEYDLLVRAGVPMLSPLALLGLALLLGGAGALSVQRHRVDRTP